MGDNECVGCNRLAELQQKTQKHKQTCVCVCVTTVVN